MPEPHPRDDLVVVVTFDTDPDRFDPSQSPGSGLSWEGVRRGIPSIERTVEDYASELGVGSIPVTWFLRSDRAIAKEMGDVGSLLDRFSSTWERLRDRGDELGFHPHLVEESKGARETLSPPRQIEQGLHAMRQRGFEPTVSRIGEARGSVEMFRTLARLGIEADSTAMPGRRRDDESRILDWRPTPELPYHPSSDDHRRPGQDPLPLLEIPMTMVPIEAPYDDTPVARYVDLTFHPGLLRPGLAQAAADAPLIVTVGHPSTILPELSSGGHPLLSYSPDAVADNLECIVSAAREAGRSVEFRSMTSCVRGVQEGVLPAV